MSIPCFIKCERSWEELKEINELWKSIWITYRNTSKVVEIIPEGVTTHKDFEMQGTTLVQYSNMSSCRPSRKSWGNKSMCSVHVLVHAVWYLLMITSFAIWFRLRRLKWKRHCSEFLSIVDKWKIGINFLSAPIWHQPICALKCCRFICDGVKNHSKVVFTSAAGVEILSQTKSSFYFTIHFVSLWTYEQYKRYTDNCADDCLLGSPPSPTRQNADQQFGIGRECDVNWADLMLYRMRITKTVIDRLLPLLPTNNVQY